MTKIFVPTYGKSEIPILQLLEKDSNLEIVLCIRSDADLSLYVDLFNKPRLKFVYLGYGIKDLGETRKRIVEYCIANDIKYCPMFDDGLTDIYWTSATASDTIEIVKNMLEAERDLPVVGFRFSRDKEQFLGVGEYDKYFNGLPMQAVVLNCDRLRMYDVNYESMSKCGLEDVAFFMDCVKKGLVFIGNSSFKVEGKLANVIVKGGSHFDETAEEFAKRRDIDHRRLMTYLGPTYGIMLTKKYRESLGFALTYARIDFGYFRDVLVFHRKENANLIRNRFKIE